MKVFVLNCGSSSFKYQLLNMPEWEVMAEWVVERIWIAGWIFTHKVAWEKIKFNQDVATHKEAILKVLELLSTWEYAVLSSMKDLDAVGHRVVHGWESFTTSAIVDEKVLAWITKCEELAPLHNPANKLGIEVMAEILPTVKQVVVFDTAFHQTMKAANYIYALPYEYYEKYGVRRYGFHWTSHKYVTTRASEIENNTNLRIINCHIGNWASIAAVNAWQVVETSMWFTPLEGLVMGTRAWDMDSAIVTYLQNKEWMSASDLDSMLNKKSWILWIFGKSSDMRDVEDGYLAWDHRATLAMDVYINRIVKYIWAYTALMWGVDMITFTAWVLENSSVIRKLIVDRLGFLNIKLDEKANDFRGQERVITTADSAIKVMVIPTNEELVIATDTYNLVK